MSDRKEQPEKSYATGSAKSLYRYIGRVGFWLGWPYFYLHLRRTERSRVLVVAGDRILLVRSWLGSGDWDLPGGGMDRGETAQACAAREVEEEAGIVLYDDSLRLLYSKQVKLRGLSFMCHFFIAELPYAVAPTARKDEIMDARWVAAADIPGYTLAKYIKPAIDGWLEGANLVQ